MFSNELVRIGVPIKGGCAVANEWVRLIARCGTNSEKQSPRVNACVCSRHTSRAHTVTVIQYNFIYFPSQTSPHPHPSVPKTSMGYLYIVAEIHSFFLVQTEKEKKRKKKSRRKRVKWKQGGGACKVYNVVVVWACVLSCRARERKKEKNEIAEGSHHPTAIKVSVLLK